MHYSKLFLATVLASSAVAVPISGLISSGSRATLNVCLWGEDGECQLIGVSRSVAGAESDLTNLDEKRSVKRGPLTSSGLDLDNFPEISQGTFQHTGQTIDVDILLDWLQKTGFPGDSDKDASEIEAKPFSESEISCGDTKDNDGLVTRRLIC